MSNHIQPATRLFFLQALSPLHVGVGEGIGHINLPTAREATTQYPYVPGSSIKGVLREEAELANPPKAADPDGKRYGEDDNVVLAFGPPSSRAGDARGGLVLTDARLLFLPMRSLIGGFALVTCPLILRRLARDAGLCGPAAPALKRLAELKLADGEGCVAAENGLAHNGQLLLEDVQLKPRADEDIAELAQWLGGKAWDAADTPWYAGRIAVVSDTLFGFFVRLHLEVRSRVCINDETGTAAASGPWLEEYIPAEAVLVGVAQGRKTALVRREPAEGQTPAEEDFAPRAATDSLDVLTNLVGRSALLRFGGKSSGGAGRAFFRLAEAQTGGH